MMLGERPPFLATISALYRVPAELRRLAQKDEGEALDEALFERELHGCGARDHCAPQVRTGAGYSILPLTDGEIGKIVFQQYMTERIADIPAAVRARSRAISRIFPSSPRPATAASE